jgi:nucleoside-diphosphate-sugar epimerase
MSRTALVIGGTGPTGPHIVAGLEARGFAVTILHTGRHELAELDHLPHLHGDVRSTEGLTEALGATTWTSSSPPTGGCAPSPRCSPAVAAS